MPADPSWNSANRLYWRKNPICWNGEKTLAIPIPPPRITSPHLQIPSEEEDEEGVGGTEGGQEDGGEELGAGEEGGDGDEEELKCSAEAENMMQQIRNDPWTQIQQQIVEILNTSMAASSEQCQSVKSVVLANAKCWNVGNTAEKMKKSIASCDQKRSGKWVATVEWL